jgi:hypothetical protein
MERFRDTFRTDASRREEEDGLKTLQIVRSE